MRDVKGAKDRPSSCRRLLAERFNICIQPLHSYHGKATRTVKHLCISHWATSNLGIILLLFLVLYLQHNKTPLNVSLPSQSSTTLKHQSQGNTTDTFSTTTAANGTDIETQNQGTNEDAYFSAFDPSDSSPQRRKIPLIIGAGMGSTGTRSLHYACCKLGIPSLHYKMYCLPDGNDDDNNLHDVMLLREHQRQAIEIFHKMRDLQYHNQKINATLVTKLKRHVAQVIATSNNNNGMVVAAIHDTPFPQMISYILQIAQEQGIPVIFLLTEREPREWIQSRSKHAMEPSLVCQDTSHAFDIVQCIENYYRSKRDNLVNASSTTIHHDDDDDEYPNNIFLSAFKNNNNSSNHRFDYFEAAAKAMERHQNMIISNLSPAFVVNFWQDDDDDESFHEMATLKQKLWDSIQPWLSLDAIETFQNYSRNGGLKMFHL